jgi:hypothetical protein
VIVGSPTHNSWRAMLDRCRYPSTNGYRNYGGRGITVCERWRIFANFLADMGRRPRGKVLDRIDVNGNYIPENCRWVTASQSSRNRRNVVLPYRQGETRKQRRYKIHKSWIERNKVKRQQYAKIYCAANRIRRALNFKKWAIENRLYRNAYKRKLSRKQKEALSS